MKQIGDLVVAKDFHRDLLFFKLVWAQLELAEAIDLMKKRGLPSMDPTEWQPNYSHQENEMQTILSLGEEMVDVVFYIADAYRLLMRRYPDLMSMDDMFDYKMKKNIKRPKRYGQEHIYNFMDQMVSHYHEEGLLSEFVKDIDHLIMKYEDKPIKNSDSKSVE